MKLSVILAGTLGLSLAVFAEPAPSPTPAPSPPACVAKEYHQFDFWLGSWVVRPPDQSAIIGTSQVTRASAGCSILEQWKAAKGSAGTSLNYYDSATETWHQLWVGGAGGILKLEGRFENGAMILIGETNQPGKSTPTKNRIIWTPLPHRKVKQEWSTSEDDQTWKISFVGIYSHS